MHYNQLHALGKTVPKGASRLASIERAADTSVGSFGLRCFWFSESGSTGATEGEGGLTAGLTAGFVSLRDRVTFALERNVSEIFDCEAERAVVGAIVSCLARGCGRVCE
jgi:hypothetical protein